MRQVRLEVIAPTLQGMGLCSTCELVLDRTGMAGPAAERVLSQYPPEWRADYERLVEWVYDLAGLYGEQIVIRVIDPQSLEGLFKGLRYWVGRYPTWVVEGHKRVVGWDRQTLEAALAQSIGSDRIVPNARHQMGARLSLGGKRLFRLGKQVARGQRRAWRLAHILAEMLYGATIHDMVRELNKERGMLERLFVLAVFGDVLGVPILPPYFALRLLPYVVPEIKTWRYSMMRERDLTDLFDQEIG